MDLVGIKSGPSCAWQRLQQQDTVYGREASRKPFGQHSMHYSRVGSERFLQEKHRRGKESESEGGMAYDGMTRRRARTAQESVQYRVHILCSLCVRGSCIWQHPGNLVGVGSIRGGLSGLVHVLLVGIRLLSCDAPKRDRPAQASASLIPRRSIHLAAHAPHDMHGRQSFYRGYALGSTSPSASPPGPSSADTNEASASDRRAVVGALNSGRPTVRESALLSIY